MRKMEVSNMEDTSIFAYVRKEILQFFCIPLFHRNFR